MASPQSHPAHESASAPLMANARSRLDALPFELRHLLVNFTLLEMRAVLALVPQLRIRSDDALRGRKLLCEWAAGEGYLALLKWAHEHGYPLLQLRDGKDACAAAARGGHLAVLQWLREQKCRWDTSTTTAAAEGGHLEVLQWAHEHGCPWSATAASAAADGGHLHMLQWLRSQGCEWTDKVALKAARNGHMDLLEWAVANGCPQCIYAGAGAICVSGNLRAVEWAATTQNLAGQWWLFGNYTPGLTLEVIRFLKELCPEMPAQHAELRSLVTRQLARVGDLAGLQWARESGFFDPEEVTKGASLGGQLAVLKWAQESQFRGSWNCETLARNGHLECLQWVVANGASLSAKTCAEAARSGHLTMLQWLREIGCEWNGFTLSYALEAGHWEVFEWACQHGCPVDNFLMVAAISDGFAEVLQWAFDGSSNVEPDIYWCELAADPATLKVLRDHNCPWSEKASAEYAWRGDLELLQWARRNGCPWDAKTASIAFQNSNLYLLQWAVENGCPMDAAMRQKWSNCELDNSKSQ